MSLRESRKPVGCGFLGIFISFACCFGVVSSTHEEEVKIPLDTFAGMLTYIFFSGCHRELVLR